MTQNILALAFLGGVLPPLVWLWFWLREDGHPEPKRIIAIAFFAGIIAIPIALVLEWGLKDLLGVLLAPGITFGITLIVAAAAIEEVVKFVSARLFLLKRKEYDEPVDAMIYLVTAALGFAATENILYLSTEFQKGFREGLITGNLRFVGSTLLHVIASGLVGYMIARTFFSSSARQRLATTLGLFLATALHALFNIFIITSKGEHIELPLVLLAITGLFLLHAFEKVKKMSIKK